MSKWTDILLSKIQTLLGERGNKADHAVRWRDLTGGGSSTMAIGITARDPRVDGVLEDIDTLEDGVLTAQQAADLAALDALAADNKAQAVRDDHDALVAGFAGTLTDAFSAVQADIGQLNTSLSGDISTVQSNVTQVSSDLSADISAVQADIGVISEHLTTVTADLSAAYDATTGQIKASALTGYYTKAEADTATSAAIDSFEAQILTPEGQVKATLLSSYYTKAEADQAIAFSEQALSSQIDDVSANLATNYYTKAGTDQAIAAESTTLQAQIGAVQSNLSAESIARADADGALAADITTLSSDIGTVSANLATNYYTKAGTDGAISAAIDSFEAEFRDPVNGQIKAAALTGYYTSAQTDSAISAVQTTLSASISAVNQSVQGWQVITDQVADVAVGAAVTVTQGASALGQSGTIIVAEGATTRDTAGTTNGARLTVPTERAILFAGQRIKIGVLARKPATNGASKFGIAYATNDVGGSGYMAASAGLTTAWQWFTFYYDVPQAVSGGADYIGIFGDDAKSGKATEIARVYVEIAAVAGELPEIGTLTGEITDIKGLDLNALTGTAFGALLTQLDVQANGLSATVTTQSSAIADLQGNASAGYLIKAQAGGAVSLIDLIAADGGGGTPTSIVKISADDILLDGSVAANKLVVGLGKNLLDNSNWKAGTVGWYHYKNGAAGAATTFVIRNPGLSYTGITTPTATLYQNTGDTTGYSDIESTPLLNNTGATTVGFPVSPGQRLEASAYVWALRCSVEIRIRYYDATGASLAFTSVLGSRSGGTGTQNIPDSWSRIGGFSTVPASAASASIHIRKRGTDAGQTNSYLFIHKPQLAVAHDGQTEFAPWSPPGTTLIDGGQVVANSITADKMVAGTITAASGIIADLAVETIKVANRAITSQTSVSVASYNRASTVSGWVAAATLNVTGLSGAQIALCASFRHTVFTMGGTAYGQWRILHNGTEIASGMRKTGSVDLDDTIWVSRIVTRNAVAGTNTFKLELNADTAVTSAVYNVVLLALQAYK